MGNGAEVDVGRLTRVRRTRAAYLQDLDRDLKALHQHNLRYHRVKQRRAPVLRVDPDRLATKSFPAMIPAQRCSGVAAAAATAAAATKPHPLQLHMYYQQCWGAGSGTLATACNGASAHLRHMDIPC